jgi:hypothetical protein
MADIRPGDHSFTAVPTNPSGDVDQPGELVTSAISGCRQRPRAFGAAFLAFVAATLCTAALLKNTRGRRQLRFDPQDEALENLQQVPSRCGSLEPGIEYNVNGGWYQSMDAIPSVDLCCALCQGEPQCVVFTFVENALPGPGCRNQCWLKGGEPASNTPKQGVTSGRPPPRKMIPALTPPAAGGNTLYCISLMNPQSDEPKLLGWQASHQASIFACDGADVYSNVVTQVGTHTTKQVDSDLKCPRGGDSQSALNAWIFIAVWKAVLDDQTYLQYAWTVKLDPDAVFFPERLRNLLPQHQGAAYLNNCQYGMHGPIEVFGRVALQRLSQDYQLSWDKKAPKTCTTGQHFGQWGEDMFMDQCLGKVLQVGQHPLEARLMCEDHCNCPDFFWCQKDDYTVSYHPFKSVGSYANCMANALHGSPAPAGQSASDAPATAAAVPAPTQAAAAAYGAAPAPAPAAYAPYPAPYTAR